MKKSLLLAPLLLAVSACASAPRYVQLPDPPKPVAPAAAMAPIPEPGWFQTTLSEIFGRSK